MSSMLIYGAYGYTGELIARRAVEQGFAPVLAGRDPARLELLARELGCQLRSATLDATELDAALQGIDVVLHCAGPFSRTSRPMVDACLRKRVHYLDITGELDVFEAIAARDVEARDAGVVLLPGAGFDVVPTDCLAAHLKQRLPTATSLQLAFLGLSRVSRGTLRSSVEILGHGNRVRRAGQLVRRRLGQDLLDVDFGRGPRPTLAIPWGDLAAAFRSTGIPHITTYAALPRRAVVPVRALGYLEPLLALAPLKRVLQKWTERQPLGPDPQWRQQDLSICWGQVSDDRGQQASARLRCTEAYTFTSHAALLVADRLRTGVVRPGYHTPATAFGSDFVLAIDGTTRSDLPDLVI